MTIVGTDNRIEANNQNLALFNSVVAINAIHGGERDFGSGIIIGPNHVLTAGHVVSKSETSAIPVETIGIYETQDVAKFTGDGRYLKQGARENAKGSDVTFLKDGFDGNGGGDDLALVKSNQSFSLSQQIGIVAFVNPREANGLRVTTGGYPVYVENININFSDLNDSISKNARCLITSPSTGKPDAPRCI